jgi:hypothetical protein
MICTAWLSNWPAEVLYGQPDFEVFNCAEYCDNMSHGLPTLENATECHRIGLAYGGNDLLRGCAWTRIALRAGLLNEHSAFR